MHRQKLSCYTRYGIHVSSYDHLCLILPHIGFMSLLKFQSFTCLHRDILCIDKTGTLTMNHAIIVNYLDSWGSPKEKVLRFAFLNSYFKTDQKYPLDDAILAYVFTNGYRFQPSKWSKIDEIPFDFIRRRVSVILETESNASQGRNSQTHDRFMITKGALEEVMRVCSFIDSVDEGEIDTFSSEDYQRILNMGEELSNRGLRIIGVAIKRLQMVCLDISSLIFCVHVHHFPNLQMLIVQKIFKP